MGRKKGFLAFALAAVLLLSFAFSASAFQERKAASPKSAIAAMDAKLQSVAIKNAAYQALSEAASSAYASSMAARQEPRLAIRAALYSRALLFEQELAGQGFAVAFWCGFPSEDALSRAPLEMLAQGKPLVPEGSLPLQDPACAGSLDVDMEGKSISVSSLGFSLCSERLGYAEASRFPPGKEVGF